MSVFHSLHGISFSLIFFSGVSHHGPKEEVFVARSVDSKTPPEGDDARHVWYASSLDNDKETDSLIIPQTRFMRRIIRMLSIQRQAPQVL
jgi:hypothetical protein